MKETRNDDTRDSEVLQPSEGAKNFQIEDEQRKLDKPYKKTVHVKICDGDLEIVLVKVCRFRPRSSKISTSTVEPESDARVISQPWRPYALVSTAIGHCMSKSNYFMSRQSELTRHKNTDVADSRNLNQDSALCQTFILRDDHQSKHERYW